jgi:hypothetical protein
VIHIRQAAHRHLTPTNILFDDEKRQTLKLNDIGVFGCPHTSPVPLTDASIRLVSSFIPFTVFSFIVCACDSPFSNIVIIHQHMYQPIVHRSN